MSNNDSTFKQAMQILAVIEQQDPCRAQTQAIIDGGHLAHLVKAAKENRLPPLDALTAFLKGGTAPASVVLGKGPIVKIDRSKAFSPAGFVGKGWELDEAEDSNSLAITELDLSQILLEDTLNYGETVVTGEERIKRLKKAKRVRLDARIFQHLYENPHLIPESWKGKVIFFDGTLLRSPGGDRCALYLFWDGERWDWYYLWLACGRNVRDPSAVVASSPKK